MPIDRVDNRIENETALLEEGRDDMNERRSFRLTIKSVDGEPLERDVVVDEMVLADVEEIYRACSAMLELLSRGR